MYLVKLVYLPMFDQVSVINNHPPASVNVLFLRQNVSFLAMTYKPVSKNLLDTKKVNGFFTFPWGHQKHECQERVYF